MKQSLKEQLNNLIRQRGKLSWVEIKQMCESGSLGRIYKVSNAERRLRHSENPDIETVEEHGHIVNYRWIGAPVQYKTYKVLDDRGQIEKTLTFQF